MKYFAYGSNMDSQRMNKRHVSFSQRVHAVLKGYTLAFNKVASDDPREGKANIVPKIDGIVEGVLYEIPESDLPKLNIHEGFPRHYYHKTVTVQTDSDASFNSLTYVAQPDKIREGLKPTREYLGHLIAAQDILTKTYIKKLESLETLD